MRWAAVCQVLKYRRPAMRAAHYRKWFPNRWRTMGHRTMCPLTAIMTLPRRKHGVGQRTTVLRTNGWTAVVWILSHRSTALDRGFGAAPGTRNRISLSITNFGRIASGLLQELYKRSIRRTVTSPSTRSSITIPTIRGSVLARVSR